MADQRVRSLLDQIDLLKRENADLEAKLVGPAVKWGILTSGKICNDFCIALSTLPNAQIHAIAARSIDSASAFAKRFDIPNAYGSYEELAADPEIDVIYIGSPHNYHKGHALMCIKNGKNVLCEKPMTLNAADAKEVIDAARSKGVFFMQGVWSRFFPLYEKIRNLKQDGTFGEIRTLNVTFGFNDTELIPRLHEPSLAGGAILDIGVYCVQIASLVFGGEAPTSVLASGYLTPTGVDKTLTIILKYANGGLATMTCSIACNLPNYCHIGGTKASAKICSPFWCPTKLELTHQGPYGPDESKPEETFEFPLPDCPKPTNFTNSIGFTYEAAAVMKCLGEKQQASSLMPDAESLVIMGIMDEVRKQIGVIYPDEQ
jgi:dihydrodiol dehydrogenase / D-xylose 1-dehydrogenase (NADP)